MKSSTKRTNRRSRKSQLSFHKKLNFVIAGIIVVIAVLMWAAELLPDMTVTPNTDYSSPYTENTYDYSKLNKTNQYYSYEDDKYTSVYGIDISEHNENVDFEKVKADGIDFVILRVGWRGYTEGGLNRDKKFEEYYAGAKKAGLKVGVYIFSQAINVKEARDEADYVLKKIKDKEIDLPIAFDYEDAGGEEGRTWNLSPKDITDNAITFMERIKRHGYEAVLYANPSWLNNRYELDRITKYKIWLAQYHDQPTYPYEFFMWQYSENGAVNGISKETDLNIWFIEK